MRHLRRLAPIDCARTGQQKFSSSALSRKLEHMLGTGENRRQHLQQLFHRLFRAGFGCCVDHIVEFALGKGEATHIAGE